MKEIILTFLIFSIVSFLPCRCYSQEDDVYILKTLSLLAQKSFSGYNSANYEDFIEYCSAKTKSLITKEYFENLYMQIYKKDFGQIIVFRPLLEECQLDQNFPVLVYQAKFEEYDEVLVTVNFMREYDTYRITRIEFDKIYPDFKN